MKPPIVVIVSACDFPNGLAAPYRIRMFGKSFASIGIRPWCVFQYAPGIATPGQNTAVYGEFDGVQFVYPLHTLQPPTSWWRMLYYKTWGLLKSVRYLHKLSREHQIAYVLSYGNTYFEDWFYSRAARNLGAKFIVEICDSPLVILNAHAKGLRNLKERLKYGLSLLKERYILPKADYLFVISRFLFRRYSTCIAPDRILLTPIIADQDSFPPGPISGSNKLRLLWIGNFRPFEGLEFLIEVIAQFRLRRSDFECHVYGVTPKHREYAGSLQQRINALGVNSWIHFHNAVPHHEVPSLLKTADILLVPREDSELNRSNLPTKLVDYLMSGRPVVSSKVGEILEYAEDRVHIVYPGSPSVEDFVDAIEFLASDRPSADQIGRAGRELAERCFDYRRVGAQIGRFLNVPVTAKAEGSGRQSSLPA